MRNESGFSLISILVSIVLLSVGVLALSRASGSLVSTHASDATRTNALSIARTYLEDVRSRDPKLLASESAVVVDETGTPDPNGRYTRSVLVEGVRHNLLQVSVVVEFPRAEQPIKLETLAFVPAS